MRKRSRLIAGCVVLLVSLLPSTSSTAATSVKAGTSCKRVGAVQVQAGKQYTCIKKGKKAVWNNGKSVTPKAPSNAGQPSAATKPTEFPVVSIDQLTFAAVYGRSRQEVSTAIAKSTYENNRLNFNVGPNVSQSAVAVEKTALTQAARLWADVYEPNQNIEVLFYDFPDLAWAKSTYAKLANNQEFRSASSCTANYCGNATASQTAAGVWVYEQGLGGGLWNRSTSAHEYTHLTQAHPNNQYWNITPIWLTEGMAQFYGEAIGYTPFDASLETRKGMHRQYVSDYQVGSGENLKALLQKNDVATVVRLMKMVEFPNPRHAAHTTAAAYLLGSYATEVLVAVYGHDAVENFIRAFAATTDWEANFKQAFGIGSEDFYRKLTPYFFEMSKEL